MQNETQNQDTQAAPQQPVMEEAQAAPQQEAMDDVQATLQEQQDNFTDDTPQAAPQEQGSVVGNVVLQID